MIRNYLTSIYFLLSAQDKSHFHILSSDEIWFFHEGTSGIIHFLDPERGYRFERIGKKKELGDMYQVHIPANTYFAAEVENQKDFVFVSCVVAPGFDFADFKMAENTELHHLFPQYEELIERFSLPKNAL